MITDIRQQYLWLEDRKLTAADRTECDRLALDAAARGRNDLADVYRFASRWFADTPYMEVQTSGSTGIPKRLKAEKRCMVNSAVATCQALGLKKGDSALLTMDLRYIGAQMMVVRALTAGLHLYVQPADGHPMRNERSVADFVAIVPLQLYHTLQNAKETERLARCRTVIVGGGSVDATLCARLQALPCAVYSTYGMTETLSHIALRRLNGIGTTTERYRPLPGVGIKLSTAGSLVINAPGICNRELVTNDIARLYNDGTFDITGRIDNVINSGGVKIQPEQTEERIRRYMTRPFVLTSVPDLRLGEALVLLVEDTETSWQTSENTEIANLLQVLRSNLPRYHAPKQVIYVDKIPLTANGKTDRPACKKLVLSRICKNL